MEKLDEKQESMGEKVEKKCNRRMKALTKIVEWMAEQDNPDYEQYLDEEELDQRRQAELNKCQASKTCGADFKIAKMRCDAGFRYYK